MPKKLFKLIPFLLIILCLWSANVFAEEYIFTTSSPFIIPRSSSIEVVNFNHNVYTTENLEDIQHLIDAGIVIQCEPMSYSELFDYTTEDKYYSYQTNLSQVSTQFAWNKGVFGDTIKIAIIDSGLYNAVSDFNLKNIIRAYDYTDTSVYSGNNYCKDEIGHGTKVAGIIAAAHNSWGVAGIAPNVELYIFKCFYLNESGKTVSRNSDIIKAAYAAIDTYGVDIINMSSGTTNSTIFKPVADYAEEKGVLVVSAVGNSGALSGDTLYYPASYDNVIGVGSTKADGHRADHSQRNDYVNIMAPGENIYSVDMGTYAQASGTSFATPHVVAALALAKSLNPNLSAQALTDALYFTADAMSDRYSGHGQLNIQALLTYVKSTLSPGKLIYSSYNSKLRAYSTKDYTVYKPTYENSILTDLTRSLFDPDDSSLLIWDMNTLSPVEMEEY